MIRRAIRELGLTRDNLSDEVLAQVEGWLAERRHHAIDRETLRALIIGEFDSIECAEDDHWTNLSVYG